MSLAILEAKTQLRELVDEFANLADEKRISDQMPLFTPDTKVKVFMGDTLVFDISGTTQLEETFTGFTANVKRSSHMNGQHDVQVDGDTATGIAYCQVKLVSDEDGHEVIQDSSIRYDDTYVRENGIWRIATRISHFTINEKRTLRS
ncbi:nuclear transport factor 2 family protein [Microbacterium sp. LMI1-1-1.1]|uniref:nuclear transport factor 2 family protein n=1 Tax=Microbacterium sp. LMI1-1-1.1 TaxID=3135223 RepID=UPI0034668F3F